MKNHQSTLSNVANFILMQHPEFLPNIFRNYKIFLSSKIANIFSHTVAYGPFKGLVFAEKSHWGATDKGAMILGIYEQEILLELSNIPERYKVFVDLGAADGYYGIGILVNKLFDKSYCYEVTEAGRAVIKENSILNGVESRVIIRGEATKNIASEIPAFEKENSILFVDVEGAEFNIFDSDVFRDFEKSIIFIEIHDFFHPNGKAEFQKLLNDAKATHSVKFIKMANRDLSVFPEICDWNDHDRWLLCSEGRAKLMTWLRLDPLHDW